MFNQMDKKHRWYVVGGALITIVLLIAFGLNTLMLHQKLNLVIERSALSSNIQLASSISTKLQYNSDFINDFAIAVTSMPSHVVDDSLLQRKSSAVGLNTLSLITWNDEGETSFVNGDDSLFYEIQFKEAMLTEPMMGTCEGGNFYYSVPTHFDDGTKGLIVALDSYHDMSDLLEVFENWDYGVRLLVNKADGFILLQKFGDECTMVYDDVLPLLEVAKKQSYPELIETKDYLITSCDVENTSWSQVSIVGKSVYMGVLMWHIMIYFVFLGLAVMYFFIIFRVFSNDLKKQEQYFIHDPVIGGYNREGFFSIASHHFAQYGSKEYAVCHLDIIDFRRINELWGEEVGNTILKFIYDIIVSHLSHREVACRNGMDHFIVLLNVSDEASLQLRVDDIVQDITTSIKEHYNGYEVSFKVGGCSLVEEPDLALAINNAVYVGKYELKHNTCVVYNQIFRKKREAEIQTNELFDESLKHHDFKIYLQPKVGSDGHIEAEVLVRWIHPELGMIYPDAFIPQIEQNGKIKQLDLYMMEEVCKMLQTCLEKGKRVIPLSINLSRCTLQNLGENIAKTYAEIKERYHIPDNLLEIEITETALIEGAEITFIQHMIDDFHHYGFKVALDDFGFAYSSLSIMKSFNVDMIKLDRNFFVDENERSRAIVASTIDLAHALNTKVCAEGIEDQSQVAFLWKSHCDFIQGYVYAKPLPLDDFEAWRSDYEK